MSALLDGAKALGPARLAALGSVAFAMMALLAVLVLRGPSDEMVLLYGDLDLREAAQIADVLDHQKIPHQANQAGNQILVHSADVAQARLTLAKEGLPSGGSVGYEIFDNANALGQTDFVQNLNRQRALEGELARTIRSLDGVTFARVQLVLPKRQLFEDDTGEPSASVVIGVLGRQPGADQVRALQNLVAGAVPNLKPERVTIVDQNSHLLAGGDGAGAASALGDDERTQTEEQIKKRVKELVEGVVGPGKARVQVTADLDLNQVTTQEEKFDPDGQVVRSTQTNEQTDKQNQPDNSGQATATANIPGTPGAGASTSTNSSASGQNEETTNYEISKTTKTTVEAPGTVKKLSIAVAVDGVTAPGVGGKPGAYTPRSTEEMQRIETLVRSAVGYDATRGDQISVINVQFDREAMTDGGVASTASKLTDFDKNDIMRGAELLVAAIVAALIIFFVVRPLLSAVGGSGGPTGMRMVTTTHTPMQVSQVAVDPQNGEPLALPAPSDIDQRIDIAKIEGQVRASSVKSVSEFVDRHPEESVSILRNWLHEA